MDLMTRFADPTLIQQMSTGEKVYASLFTTALGMLITFCALIVLWGLTAFYSKLVQNAEAKRAESVLIPSKPLEKAAPPASAAVQEDEEELVAVISAAIAATLGTSVQNIVVRNIVRVPDQTPAWGQSGRVNQMHARF